MTTSGERYALVQFGRDGLLLDLASGNVFHLNESASLVWAGSLEGESAGAVAETLARRYGLPLAVAQADVALALTLAPDTSTIDEADGPYRYGRCDAGYVFSRGDRPLIVVDENGDRVSAVDGDAVPPDIAMVLQAVAPKLLALRGHLVLHASAVLLDETLVAFSGRSGAGKTTTARTLARAGAQLLCEDKLLMRTTGGRIDVMTDGERRIMAWVAAAASELSAGRSVPCGALDDAARGESRPLDGVAFLDASRRGGLTISAAPLDRARATRALFANTFHGSDRPADWRRHLEEAANATDRVDVYEITVPDGLAVLESAAADLMRNGKLFRPR
jgi:hypothetical protein